MFILVDNTTNKVIAASFGPMSDDANTTMYEITDGTTIDDIIDSDSRFNVMYDGTAFVSLTSSEMNPNITGEAAMNQIRVKRDELLLRYVDPYVCNPLRWESLTPATQQSILDYRQALLDITTTYSSALFIWNETNAQYEESNIVWPDLPTIA